MAFSELEQKRYEKLVGRYVEARRPPPDIRPELDLGFRVHGQSVEIFEVRPAYENPSVSLESPVAKTTYVKKRNGWRIFWRRADLKWHSYDPAPFVGSLEEFLAIVEADEHCCFYG